MTKIDLNLYTKEFLDKITPQESKNILEHLRNKYRDFYDIVLRDYYMQRELKC